jgi:hypothetical protein
MSVTLDGVPSAQRGSCGGLGGERALSLTLTQPSDVFVSTHGASVDTVVYVRSCNCTGPELGCSDDADRRTSSALALPNLAAGTYTIWIDTYAATTMTATIPVDVYVTPTAPRGDRCGAPIAIAPGTTHLSGSTCAMHADYSAVVDGNCTNASAGAGTEQIYYFYLTASATVTLSGCGTPGFGYDGVMYIRSACNGTTQRVCDDDGCGGIFSSNHSPEISTTLPAGLYYLFVDGFGSGGSGLSCGTFDLTVSGI